jgi:hypothetical protein
MRTIIITTKQLRREIFVWFFCLVGAITLNTYAIVYYKTNWSEFYSQAGLVFVLSIEIYILLWIFRGSFLLIRHLIRKRNS